MRTYCWISIFYRIIIWRNLNVDIDYTTTVEGIKNIEIKRAMHHPASLRQILSFRQFRMQNLCLYLISVLPSPFSVTAIWVIGKLKKLI